MAYNAKTNWAIDNVVLPADMNRIEQGIKDVDTGKAPLSHTHTIANITGLQSTLDGKASSSHNHSISNITGLQSALDAKASSTHTHNLAVASSGGSGGSAGFMSAQEKEKLATIEAGAGAPTTIIDNLTSQNIGAALSANQGYVLKGLIDGKANSSHSHSISNVSGLQSALDGKASSSHIHAPATSTSHGFMSSSDKTKLEGISNNATETYVIDGLSSTSTTSALSANQGRLLKGMIDDKAPSIHAHTNATTSSAGFMSTDDKSKLDGIAANANRTIVTNSLTSTSTTAALSANQGKVLNDNLSNLLGQMDDKMDKYTNKMPLGSAPFVDVYGGSASIDFHSTTIGNAGYISYSENSGHALFHAKGSIRLDSLNNKYYLGATGSDEIVTTRIITGVTSNPLTTSPNTVAASAAYAKGIAESLDSKAVYVSTSVTEASFQGRRTSNVVTIQGTFKPTENWTTVGQVYEPTYRPKFSVAMSAYSANTAGDNDKGVSATIGADGYIKVAAPNLPQYAMTFSVTYVV